MPSNPVWAFALRVFLWLAPCFAAWYLIAPWHGRMAGWLAGAFVDVYRRGLVSALEYQEHSITFVTTVSVRAGSDQLALLLPEVNPLLYTYGLALLLALLLAGKAAWWTLLAGPAALLPFQAWGIAFDLLAQLVRISAEVAAQAGLVGWRREFAALGYQLGSLIFPVLAPVMIWGALDRKRLATFTRPGSPGGASRP